MHNLGALSQLSLINCLNLTWFSWEEAFQQLKSMKKLNIAGCPKLFSMPAGQEEEYYKNNSPLPGLEELTIESCGIRGNQFNHVLSRLPSLSTLELTDCPGEEGNECTLMIPIGSLTSLKELYITNCIDLSCGNKEGFTGLSSIQTLRIIECPKLLSSLIPDNMEEDGQISSRIFLPSSLQRLVLDGVCEKMLPISGLTSLKELGITESSDLESIDLSSCTELEEIGIHRSGLLSSIQGLQTCISLRSLRVYDSPGFWNTWSNAMAEGLKVHLDVFCLQLERIWTDDLSLLTSCSCKYMQSLKWLVFLSSSDDGDDNSIIEVPIEAFPLLTSLQELSFDSYKKLSSLPGTLHLLPSLKKLAIKSCVNIVSLEELGLPVSLEELHISGCESLQSLPAKLNSLPCFNKLELSCCPGIVSLKDQLLPCSIGEIVIEYCENLQYLPDALHLLSSLSKLEIKSCPSMKSMPESGLPPSLIELLVWDCSEEFKKQCAEIQNKRTLHMFLS